MSDKEKKCFFTKVLQCFKALCCKTSCCKSKKNEELKNKMKDILKNEKDRTSNLYSQKIHDAVNKTILNIISELEVLDESEESKKKLTDISKDMKTKYGLSENNIKEISSLISKQKVKKTYDKNKLSDQLTKYSVKDLPLGDDKEVNLDPEMFENEITVISNKAISEADISKFNLDE